MSLIDISQKLDDAEEAKLKIDKDHEFPVDCSASTMLVAEQKFKKGKTLKDYYDVIELFIGKEASELIKSKNLSISKLNTVIIAIMALANELTYEEMEKRFREQFK